MARKIGTYRLTERHDFHRGQEFAGAVYTVRVEPGEYPITVERDRAGQRYIAIKMPGICTEDSWFGSNVRVSHPMTPDVFSFTAATVSELMSYGCPHGGVSAITLDADVMREHAAREVCSSRRVLEYYKNKDKEPMVEEMVACLARNIAQAQACGATVCHEPSCKECSRPATSEAGIAP